MTDYPESGQAVSSLPHEALYPLIPLRDIVIFPAMVTPLFVGRPRSIQSLEAANIEQRLIFLTTQKDPKIDDPIQDDLYKIGVIGQIIQLLKLPDGTVKVLIEGKERARVISLEDRPECLYAKVVLEEELLEDSDEIEAMSRSVLSAFENYINLSKKIPPEMFSSISGIKTAGRLADAIIPQLNVKVSDKQHIMEQINPLLRLENLLTLLEHELQILGIEKKIRSRVKSQMERSQKEYYLNEQMRAIQKELGDKDDFKQELRELEDRINSAGLSKEAKEKTLSELRKLKLMSPMSAEATVVRNYIDWIVSIPWKRASKDRHDLLRAEKILNTDHYGLHKVKERILEYLAVQAQVKKIKGPIICLLGPPGVGKTSLGRSIAKALERKFVRISLGGVRDEAEIRGHRRTYIGAMPGKIIQGMRKTGVVNPVFLLDEIDKMSTDFRGDPSSALLEVLDPEQNHTFSDHFLDVEYDLSAVMFIATANSLHTIPRALLDRMEIIRVEGYTEEEKLHIAQRYLIPKQIQLHGFSPDQLKFSSSSIYEIIRYYTREAGVRNLEREIAAVCRKLTRRLLAAHTSKKNVTVTSRQINGFLGIHTYSYGALEAQNMIGIATGLAWTAVGGETLIIETAILPGNGKLTVTGKLGEVMRESSQAALSYIRSRWLELDLEQDFYNRLEIHIHIPEGATPKDGPSAGITMATAIASALTGRAVDKNLAMTGEITLRGRVLAIGGLKEKLLAAKRAGITRILIPEENRKDLTEILPSVLRGLTIIPVIHMDQVLERALLPTVENQAEKSEDTKPLTGQ